QSFQGLFTIFFLALALAILFKFRTRWHDVVPVVGFLVLGLVAVRNLPAGAGEGPAGAPARARAPPPHRQRRLPRRTGRPGPCLRRDRGPPGPRRRLV